jgi:RNA polymerase sigma factor (sigma-70 family)
MTAPVLRLRSDEQLVTLFRAGHDEAFRVIHDRYHQRLSAYTRQMLPRRQDAEDALQDVFVRVYTSLRASERKVDRLRPWLYRAAHNRCVDELRRPPAPPPEVLAEIRSPIEDPVAQVVERESVRRVLEHVGRLPAQQRSALLLRELGGAHYDDIAIALGTTVPAVKSLLVRARMTLASSLEASDTPCSTIREELTLAHDNRVRPNSTARSHMRDCRACRDFREQLRGTSRHLKALVPALGPLGALANALGFGGAGSGVSAGGGAAVAGGGGSIGGGALASAGVLSGGHVATLVAAAVATAGGAVAIQNTVMPPSRSPANVSAATSSSPANTAGVAPSALAGLTPQPNLAPVTIPPAGPSAPSPAATPSSTAPLPPAINSSSSAPPTPSSAATSISASPIRQPSTTGIDAVSTSKAAPTSAIGHTAITGTAQVSAIKPSTSSQSASASNATTSTNASTSTNSSGSGSSPASTITGSQGGATDSPQSATSSSSTGSTTWGTTSTDAASQ